MVKFEGEFTPREHALILSAIEDAIVLWSKIEDPRSDQAVRDRAAKILRDYKALQERLKV